MATFMARGLSTTASLVSNMTPEQVLAGSRPMDIVGWVMTVVDGLEIARSDPAALTVILKDIMMDPEARSVERKSRYAACKEFNKGDKDCSCLGLEGETHYCSVTMKDGEQCRRAHPAILHDMTIAQLRGAMLCMPCLCMPGSNCSPPATLCEATS